jgi:hypothetical protein
MQQFSELCLTTWVCLDQTPRFFFKKKKTTNKSTMNPIHSLFDLSFEVDGLDVANDVMNSANDRVGGTLQQQQKQNFANLRNNNSNQNQSIINKSTINSSLINNNQFNQSQSNQNSIVSKQIDNFQQFQNHQQSSSSSHLSFQNNNSQQQPFQSIIPKSYQNYSHSQENNIKSIGDLFFFLKIAPFFEFICFSKYCFCNNR